MNATPEPRRERAAAPSGRPRLLVCDDSDTVRHLLGQILEAEFECRLVSSGPEALACADDFAPDLIIADLLMPGMDGYQLLRLLRAQPALAGIPVVMLTCVSDGDSRAQGLELGAEDYIVKPIRRRELLARVKSLLRVRRAMDHLKERSRALEDSNRTLAATQQSLVRAEKLATVGTLVAGLAHEMSGPVACLGSGTASAAASLADLRRALDGALAAVPEDRRQALGAACHAPLSEAASILAEMAEGSARLQRVARELRAFASSDAALLEEVDLLAEVRRAWDAAAPPRGTRLLLEGGESVIQSVADLVAQALTAVVRNAVEAAGPQGEVRISLRPTLAGVLVSVQDSGPGIRPEHLPRVFDPFFTTKPVGSGRGMSLAVAYGIMRSLGGRIEAASEPRAGATFRLWLPRRPPGVDGHEL
ncbi:MAG TPA: hybrid sensor histidine kinase/response regulator, partial [Anaeromyxobacteraceae bacterium]|nr:hybrid sensor histidine kinase/response regulator [Anaeromyxobacteraceae bacterium]